MAELGRVRVTFSGLQGGTGVHTSFWEAGSSFLTTDAQAAANKVGTFWTALAGKMTNSISWTTGGTVDVIDPANGELLHQEVIAPQSGVGTAIGDKLSGAIQGLAQLRTGGVVAGRIVRGRFFIPGAREDDNSVQGVPEGAYRSTVDAALTTLRADTLPNLMVWSRPQEAPLPVRAGSAHKVTGAATWTKWAVLRSRRD